MNLFLWGMMGAGKSHFIRMLSEFFPKLKTFDLDKIIEQKTAQSIPQLFSSGGEELFRRIEHKTLQELINADDNFVLATGGGTPCFFDNAEIMLQNGLTIYLKTPIDILYKRLWDEKDKRPLLKNYSDPEELKLFLSKLLEKREKCYSKAHIIWDSTLPPNLLIKKFSQLIDVLN